MAPQFSHSDYANFEAKLYMSDGGLTPFAMHHLRMIANEFSLHKSARFQYYDMNKWQHAMASVLVDSEDDYRTSLTESKLETFRDGRHGMELTVGGLAQAYKTDGNLAEDLIKLGIGGIGSVARGIVDMKLSVNGDHPSAKEITLIEGEGVHTKRKMASFNAAFMTNTVQDRVYSSLNDLFGRRGDAPSWLRHPGALVDAMRTVRTSISGGGGLLSKMESEKARLSQLDPTDHEGMRYASACADALDAYPLLRENLVSVAGLHLASVRHGRSLYVRLHEGAELSRLLPPWGASSGLRGLAGL